MLSLERAVHQDIRELHVGFLNMMPDAALEATERQFIRLVGGCNRIAQFYVYPFSLPGLRRSRKTFEYIASYYTTFEELKANGLDALIITGANVSNPALESEPFWEPLMEVIGWAQQNVASTLCSCLATHVALKHFHGIERQPLPEKRWGVYPHRIASPQHPLMREINTRFDVPHSRYNDISRRQLEQAGLTVLVDSEKGGVHMAVSPDQFRVVYLQGHPEYDTNSLLKEYKREVLRYLNGEFHDAPPFPERYFPDAARHVAERFVAEARQALWEDRPLPDYLESGIQPLLENTWGDTAKAIVANWLGLVYQLTNLDRQRQYMDGVDPRDPLNLSSRP